MAERSREQSQPRPKRAMIPKRLIHMRPSVTERRSFLNRERSEIGEKERAQNHLPENEPDRVMKINRRRHQDVKISSPFVSFAVSKLSWVP
jgi:hypothetical protein